MNMHEAIEAAVKNIASHGDTDIFPFPFECPGWPLENPPSVAGPKSPSDRALISTSFFDYRQSYLFFIPYFL
ncbi:MAG: hypothetical protein WC405_15650, partial [Syntrophales bacterium]